MKYYLKQIQKYFAYFIIFIIFAYILGFICRAEQVKSLSNIVITNVLDTNIYFIAKKDTNSVRNILILRKETDKQKVFEFKNEYKFSENVIDLKQCPIADSGYFILSELTRFKELNIQLIGLSPATKYFIDFFSLNKKGKISGEIKSINFLTLAAEPINQASQIAFKNTTDSSISMTWSNGSGYGRIILVRKDTFPSFPKDGIVYVQNSSYGDLHSQIDNNGTYIVGNFTKYNSNNLTVTKLGYGNYYFQVFEYNGENENINYLLKSGFYNPRSKYTSLPTPKAFPATDITADGFTANWSEIQGAETFLIEIATDENFQSLIDIYNPADVGPICNLQIIELKPKTKYFLRVRAVGKESRSEYSNIISVQL